MSAEDNVSKLQAVQVYLLAMCQMFEIEVNDVLSLFSLSDRISFTDEDIASLIEPEPEQQLPPFSPIVTESIEGGFRVRSNSKLFIIIALVVILQISMTDAISRTDVRDRRSLAKAASASAGAPAASASAGAPAASDSPAFDPPGWFERVKLDYEEYFFSDKGTGRYMTKLYEVFLLSISSYQNRRFLTFVALTANVFLGPLFSISTIFAFMIKFLSQRNSSPLLNTLTSAGVAGTFAITFLVWKTYWAERHTLPPLLDTEKLNLTKNGYQDDQKHFISPPIWLWLDLNIRIDRLKQMRKDLNNKVGPLPVAGQLAIQNVAGQLPRPRRLSVVKRQELQELNATLVLVNEYITRLDKIKEEYGLIDRWWYGENVFASRDSLLRALKYTTLFGAFSAVVPERVLALLPEQALGGGASYICKRLTYVLAGVYVLLLLVIILVFVSRFIDSFEPNGKIDPNMYQDFINRFGSIENIQDTVIQIFETMFDNAIYRWIKHKVIPDFIKNFAYYSFLSYMFIGSSSILTSLITLHKVSGYTLKDIIELISFWAKIIFSGAKCAKDSIYKLHKWVYDRLLNTCGFFFDVKEKDFKELPELLGNVFKENIPKLNVSSSTPAAVIKEENKLLLPFKNTTLLLDKTKVRIDPLLYKKFENSIFLRPTRSRPSRKRTASRPSRSRPSRSRSRPSRSRTSPRRVKKTSRAKSKRR